MFALLGERRLGLEKALSIETPKTYWYSSAFTLTMTGTPGGSQLDPKDWIPHPQSLGCLWIIQSGDTFSLSHHFDLFLALEND